MASKIFKKFHTNINTNEISKFALLAPDFWDPNGSAKFLHLMNPVRITFMRKVLANLHNKSFDSVNIFKNKNFLDIGCGAGLLCEVFILSHIY